MAPQMEDLLDNFTGQLIGPAVANRLPVPQTFDSTFRVAFLPPIEARPRSLEMTSGLLHITQLSVKLQECKLVTE